MSSAARTGNGAGNVVAKGYGQPVPGVTIGLINRTDAEHSIKTPDNTGWYLRDEGYACTMPLAERPYNVWGNKTGNITP
jgi:hypothetical protein